MHLPFLAQVIPVYIVYVLILLTMINPKPIIACYTKNEDGGQQVLIKRNSNLNLLNICSSINLCTLETAKIISS